MTLSWAMSGAAVSYLVPGGHDLGPTEDEGEAHGEVCGPHDESQQEPPSLGEHVRAHQPEHSQEHKQAAAHHTQKGTVLGCFLLQQPGENNNINMH